MLRPASVTALLQQLIAEDGRTAKPHTALLSLLESSELYAYATRLPESSLSTRQAKVGGSASSSIAKHQGPSLSLPLSLEERIACLSAIAVAAWRKAAVQPPSSETAPSGCFIAGPGMRVAVPKHTLSSLPGTNGARRIPSQDYVPLLLECELGRILVMPIVPSQPQTTPSRAELAVQEGHDEGSPHPAPMQEVQQPFMLLVLNAPLPATEAQSSLAPYSRPRFRSGGTTPATSYGSSGQATPTRSPTSDHFPRGTEADAHEGDAAEQPEADAKSDEEEEMVWTALYAQAKALARLLAPSLAKCGVGHGLHDEENGDGRRSTNAMSEDENED